MARDDRLFQLLGGIAFVPPTVFLSRARNPETTWEASDVSASGDQRAGSLPKLRLGWV